MNPIELESFNWFNRDTSCLAAIVNGNHLIPFRTQKWKRLTPMIVWSYPCESRSLPGILFRKPLDISISGGFFMSARCDLIATVDGIKGSILLFGFTCIQNEASWRSKGSKSSNDSRIWGGHIRNQLLAVIWAIPVPLLIHKKFNQVPAVL